MEKIEFKTSPRHRFHKIMTKHNKNRIIGDDSDETTFAKLGGNINDLLEELSNDYILFVMQNDEKANRINIETSRIMEDELMF